MNAVKEKPSLIYELDEPLAPDKLLVYGLQHLFFCLANAAVVPVVVGICLGLDSQGTASLVQRTFFFCGLASILQATWGHKYPIFEGPAGMW